MNCYRSHMAAIQATSMNFNMDCHYEIALEKALKEIKKCQNDTMKKQTCFGCVKFFSCQTRQDYVKKVYSSMSKDKAGNFEFN